jgi:hypothetical protein
MAAHELPPVERLAVLVHNLLISRMILNESVVDSAETDANMTLLHVNSALEDHIILGLCEMSDESGATFGDPGFLHSMRSKKVDDDHRVSAQSALADLKSCSRQLREQRDTRIARIEPAGPTTEAHPHMLAALRAAVDLVDALDGHHNTYQFLGKDLREVVLGEKLDPISA